jgi:uncharacterized protein YegP (UPF0339 family)
MPDKPILRNVQSFAEREKTPEWKFIILQENSVWKWLLQDSEAVTVAESRRQYKSREDCERGINIIRLKILRAGVAVNGST